MGALPLLGCLWLLAVMPQEPLDTPPQPGLRTHVSVSSEAKADGVDLDEVESRLRQRVGRIAGLDLLDKDDYAADLEVQILECRRIQRQRLTTILRLQPSPSPKNKPAAAEASPPAEAHPETVPMIFLKVQLEAPGREVDIVSDPRDRTLQEAVDTVAAEVENAFRSGQLLAP